MGKETWQMTRDEFVGNKTGDEKAVALVAHPQHVKQALEDGKDVPLNVLEGYKNNYWAEKAIESHKKAEPPDEVNVKDPWKMTREEWDRQIDQRDLQGMSLDEAINKADKQDGSKYSLEDDVSLVQRRRDAHKKVVQKAMSEGKYEQALAAGTMRQEQVDAILKDYPHLQKPGKVEPPATEAKKPKGGL